MADTTGEKSFGDDNSDYKYKRNVNKSAIGILIKIGCLRFIPH